MDQNTNADCDGRSRSSNVKISTAEQTQKAIPGSDFRTGMTNPYPARQAASIVALAAFNVAWVSRAILPFAIKLRSLAFRVVVE